jgi:hypothetical protein
VLDFFRDQAVLLHSIPITFVGEQRSCPLSSETPERVWAIFIEEEQLWGVVAMNSGSTVVSKPQHRFSKWSSIAVASGDSLPTQHARDHKPQLRTNLTLILVSKIGSELMMLPVNGRRISITLVDK